MTYADSTTLPASGHARLKAAIAAKQSFVCIGLDIDLSRIPSDFEPDLALQQRIVEFNHHIVQATQQLAVAYKLNAAFYEAIGSTGYGAMEDTISMLRQEAPDTLIILDAKRGDVAHTAERYAYAYFTHLNVDAVTLSPYMGKDSVLPFLSYQDKWIILCAATSNVGFEDFQVQKMNDARALWEHVLHTCSTWGTMDQIMFVVGATRRLDVFSSARRILPKHFFLVPGVGTQGGSLEAVYQAAKGHILVNSSRSILYNGTQADQIRPTAQAASRQLQRIASRLLIQTD